MRQRVFSTIIYLAIFIPLLFVGGFLFDLFAVFLAIIILSELLVMKGIPIQSFAAIFSYLSLTAYILAGPNASQLSWLTQSNIFIFIMMALLIYMVFSKLDIKFDDISVMMFGLFYIGNGFSTLISMRDVSFLFVLYLMVIIWVTDTGAFLVGRRLGKHPLAPAISPKKTIEGAVGGVVLSMLIATLFTTVFPLGPKLNPGPLAVAFMSAAAQMGDLVESAIKRHYRIKDSGDILPGHGGMFDRFDSLIFLMNVIKLMIDFGMIA